jgi:phytanoyl-CoA hydroxylase
MLKNYLNEFNNNGFVVIRGLIPKKEISIIKNEIKKISNILVKNYGPPYVHLAKDLKLNTAHHLNKIFPKSKVMSLSENKKIKILLEKKFKEKMLMNNFEIFAKPNKTGKRVPFHQDNFYWNIKNDKAANVWIALNKVDKTNGGLIYYKGSHKLGLKTHSISNVPGSSQEIKPNILKKLNQNIIQPKLSPGDCIIHHCKVIHGSEANRSNRTRLAIAIRFTSKNAKIDKKKMSVYLKKLKV